MRLKTVLVSALCLILSPILLAQHDHPAMSEEQKQMMEAYAKAGTPGAAHKALEPLVGKWDTVIRFYPAPGAPPQESTGVSETRWVLGGRYLEQRFRGEAMGQPFEGLGYTGYDNIRKHYFTTWMDSMSTAIMASTGQSESGGKSWKFQGTMDDPVTGKAMPVDELLTVHGPDRHTFEMWSPAPDGKKYKSMEIVYTRKKS